jgi:hypothetical protein
MGTAARNIVLVGDQQQLAQPVKGRHPAGAEASVSSTTCYRGGRPSARAGILLDTSRRMHPAVCGWVSETFYEGRLRAHPDATRQMFDPSRSRATAVAAHRAGGAASVASRAGPELAQRRRWRRGGSMTRWSTGCAGWTATESNGH